MHHYDLTLQVLAAAYGLALLVAALATIVFLRRLWPLLHRLPQAQREEFYLHDAIADISRRQWRDLHCRAAA